MKKIIFILLLIFLIPINSYSESNKDNLVIQNVKSIEFIPSMCQTCVNTIILHTKNGGIHTFRPCSNNINVNPGTVIVHKELDKNWGEYFYFTNKN